TLGLAGRTIAPARMKRCMGRQRLLKLLQAARAAPSACCEVRATAIVVTSPRRGYLREVHHGSRHRSAAAIHRAITNDVARSLGAPCAEHPAHRGRVVVPAARPIEAVRLSAAD